MKTLRNVIFEVALAAGLASAQLPTSGLIGSASLPYTTSFSNGMFPITGLYVQPPSDLTMAEVTIYFVNGETPWHMLVQVTDSNSINFPEAIRSWGKVLAVPLWLKRWSDVARVTVQKLQVAQTYELGN